MKKAQLLIAFLGALLAIGPAAAQTQLTQTTLAAAVGSGSTRSGLNQPYTTQVSLSSATGVSVAVNGSPVTALLVDGEAMSVLSLVQGQTTVFTVLRGQYGTPVEDHAAGAVVYVQNVSPQYGGFTGPGGLETTDPPRQGNCLATGTAGTPWINMTTGQQWVCATVYTPAGTGIASWIPASQSNFPGQNSPLTLYVTSAYTNATTTASAVSGMAFYAQPNRNYGATCHITWEGSASTAGPSYEFTGPSSPTAVALGVISNVTSSTYTSGSATAFGTAVSNSGSVTTSTNFTDTVTLGVVNGSTGGVIQLKAAADGTGTLTIQPGSYCIVQ